jgi:hypothetical protein
MRPLLLFFTNCSVCRKTRLTEWVLLLCNHRQLRRHLSVQFGKGFPLFRQIVLVENCFYRALWNTCLTVDAFIRMNVKHLVALIKAFDWAHDNTVCVLAGEAGFSNDMRHNRLTPYQNDLKPTRVRLLASVFQNSK